MTGKRILMVLEVDFPPDVRVEKEAQSLIEAGHEVHIACFNFSGRPSSERWHGMHIHRMTVPKQVFRKSQMLMNIFPLYPWIWHFFLNRIMYRISFHALHIHDLPLCGIGLRLAARYNIPLVADMHENYPYLIKDQPFMRFLLARMVVNFPKWVRREKKWLSAASFVITTCEGMKERLVREGIPGSRIHVLENTIRIGQEVPESPVIGHKGTVLIYTGGLSEDRGLQYALEGFQLVREVHPDVLFWIVGEGRYRNYLEQIIEEKQIQGIEFFGWRNRAGTNEILIRADIGVIPHVKSVQNDNASPNKLFEYFLYGKPVLASNCDYLTRIMAESGAGCNYEYNSPKSFAEALTRMLEQDIVEMGSRGHQIVIRKYNWETTKTALLNLYSFEISDLNEG